MNTSAAVRNGSGNGAGNGAGFSLEKQGPAIFQHEIVEILLNSERIQLNHFLASKAEDQDSLPLLACVASADLGGPAIVQAAVARARSRSDERRRIGRAAFVVALVCLAMAASFLMGNLIQSASSPVPDWRVLRVVPSGVLVGVGTLQVPVDVGGVLPDGQRLLGVDSARQIYSTPVQDVRVRHPAPADALSEISAPAQAPALAPDGIRQ